MNSLFNSARIALRALRVNKLRSVLTMLGIIIGVAAVIAMVAIGAGASKQVQDQIESLGSNLLIIQPGSQNTGGVRNGWGNALTLTRDDAEAITAQLATVSYAAPTVQGAAQIVYSGNNWYSRVEGVTPAYFPVRNFVMSAGAPFTEADDQLARKVAVIGQTVVEQIFGNADPIGQSIRMNNVPFVVVGTLKAKGQSPTGQDQDDTILIPLTTAKRKLLGRSWANAQSVRNIYVQAKAPELIPVAMQQVEDLLRFRHQLRPDEADDFQVSDMTSRYQAQAESAQVMTIMLAAIASISLFVGGIGIMNIMLVSVTERTKEIGLRQAVGAKTKDILTQFLVEAVTLSLIGGLIGIALGAGASRLLTYLAGWSTLISLPTIIGASVFSGLVGVFFGYYPARRAAVLDPIEALRYE